jgi:myosin-1
VLFYSSPTTGFCRYRRWKAQQYYVELKQKATDILVGHKERRKGTINRNFVGDYIGSV